MAGSKQRREKHSVTMTTWYHSLISEWQRKTQPTVSGCFAGSEQAIPEAPKSKKGFPKYRCRFQKLEPIWFPKTGNNEMKQTVGFHFVVPCFWEPNRFQFLEPIFKKKDVFFRPNFFLERFFSSNRTVVLGMIVPYLFLLRVRRNRRKA